MKHQIKKNEEKYPLFYHEHAKTDEIFLTESGAHSCVTSSFQSWYTNNKNKKEKKKITVVVEIVYTLIVQTNV